VQPARQAEQRSSGNRLRGIRADGQTELVVEREPYGEAHPDGITEEQAFALPAAYRVRAEGAAEDDEGANFQRFALFTIAEQALAAAVPGWILVANPRDEDATHRLLVPEMSGPVDPIGHVSHVRVTRARGFFMGQPDLVAVSLPDWTFDGVVAMRLAANAVPDVLEDRGADAVFVTVARALRHTVDTALAEAAIDAETFAESLLAVGIDALGAPGVWARGLHPARLEFVLSTLLAYELSGIIPPEAIHAAQKASAVLKIGCKLDGEGESEPR